MLLSPSEKNPEPLDPTLLMPNDNGADDGALANGRNCDGDGAGDDFVLDELTLRLGWILLLALEAAATDVSDLSGDAVAVMTWLDLSYPILSCPAEALLAQFCSALFCSVWEAGR
jgi:hypothetical protein